MKKKKTAADKRIKEAYKLKEFIIEVRKDPEAVKQVKRLLQTC